MTNEKCARDGCNNSLPAIPVVFGTIAGPKLKYCSAICLFKARKEESNKEKETEAAT